MTNTAAIAMIAWVPVVLVLFAKLPHRRAAVAAFVAGWLLLPVVNYPVAGLPDYSKVTATCGAPLVAICIFDLRRFMGLRLCWADVPVLVFCVSPFASALRNGMGIHEALSAVFAQSLSWAVPYAVGRCYFHDLPGLRELAIGIFAGAALYVPMSLFELWSGYELSRVVYGYRQMIPVISFGIVRPKVFLQSGMMLALWMSAATVLAIWLWKSAALPSFRYFSLRWVVPVLIATVILIRSVNGWIEMMLGIALIFSIRRWQTAAPVIGLMILALAYIGVRAAGLWSGDEMVVAVQKVFNEQKGRSIRYRLVNEDEIATNAREHSLLGWGRSMVPFVNRTTLQRAVPDSMWIVVFANYGVLGLLGFTGTILTPVILLIRRIPASTWFDARIAPAAALGIVLVIYLIDHLANGMEHPAFLLAAGGLSGFHATSPVKLSRANA